jgi:hypothetical protein
MVLEKIDAGEAAHTAGALALVDGKSVEAATKLAMAPIPPGFGFDLACPPWGRELPNAACHHPLIPPQSDRVWQQRDPRPAPVFLVFPDMLILRS